MAVVTVKRPKHPKPKPEGHPHVSIVSSAGTVVLGTVDEKVVYSGLGSTWVEVERPGTNSLARRANRNRLKAEVTAMLVDGVNGATVNQQIRTLDAIGASSATCGVSLGEMSRHRWILAEAKPTTIDRAPLTNAAKHADVTLTFWVAVDEQTTVAVSRTPKPPSDKGKPKHGTTTVHKGETLAKVAKRVYGNANRAGELAKLNHIRNPRKIHVGQKIKY